MPAGFADGVDNNSGGKATSVTASTGFSGGIITGSGTIGIANGGVGTAQIAAGAVGSAQIDPTYIQRRIIGTCAIGEYFRGINADGSVACEAMPGVQRITTVDDLANGVGFFASMAIDTLMLRLASHVAAGGSGVT